MEGVWDLHRRVLHLEMPFWSFLPPMEAHPQSSGVATRLLALPQGTHMELHSNNRPTRPCPTSPPSSPSPSPAILPCSSLPRLPQGASPFSNPQA